MKNLTIIIAFVLCSISFKLSSQELQQLTIESAVGLTEAELYERFPETKIPTSSFLNLVSKNLHPYHAPATNKFLQYGSQYIVFELKCGNVIAIHKVSG